MHRILIVPDTILSELSASFLDRRSFTLRTAIDATEALSLAAVWVPHLLIFSSSIRDLTPEELCRKVRADPDLARCKLMMITDAIGAAPLDNIDFNSHLVQPFEQGELLRAIGALIDTDVRRADRLTMGLLLARIHEESDGPIPKPLLGNVLELSETGLLAETERHLKLGDEVVIFVVLPGQNDRLELRAKVVSADELNMRYAFGFTESIESPGRMGIMVYVDLQMAARAEATQTPQE